MADLVDRQMVIDAVRSYYDECDEREESIEERIEQLPSAGIDLSGFSDKLWAAAYERGKAEALDRVPSAERHGKWIHDGYDFPHGVDWMHCSECGKLDVYCPAARTNFCPNCGARMDGKHDG